MKNVSPLVKVTGITINQVSYRVLTVQEPGLLLDILREDSEAQIPEIPWNQNSYTTDRKSCTYGLNHDEPSIEGQVYLALEAANIKPLSDEDVRNILASNHLTKTTSAEVNGQAMRVANVFITRTLLPGQKDEEAFHTPTHWQVGIDVLSPTLFMSMYGPGTTLFMSAC